MAQGMLHAIGMPYRYKKVNFCRKAPLKRVPTPMGGFFRLPGTPFPGGFFRGVV